MLKFHQLASLKRSAACVRLGSISPSKSYKNNGVYVVFEPSSGISPLVCSSTPVRCYGSYYKSRTEESPEAYTSWEKSFDEWKFVEKLIPPAIVPEPPSDPNIELPSGWKPQNPPKDCPYLLVRTKNHAIPVYLKIYDRGMLKETAIRRVEGNIWQLEKDIGNYLKLFNPNKVIVTRCLEPQRMVVIKGDYVDQVMEWAKDRGF